MTRRDRSRPRDALLIDGDGRDPREMTPDELKANFDRVSPLEAIRERCIDCCGGSKLEVRLCTAIDCGLYLFRMGTDPWRRRTR